MMIFRLVLILLLLPSIAWASDCTVAGGSDCTKEGTTYTCTTAFIQCIQAAVTDATAGDTINVTDTTARTWGTNLSITKGITLTGPGLASLTITKGSASGYMISYDPANPALNSLFKIQGFKFDGDQKGSWLVLEDVGNTNIQTNIVIINNHIHNFSGQAILAGKHRGVIAKNIFTGTNYPLRFTSGVDAWGVLAGLTYGNADTMWIEDNTMTVAGAFIDCDSANRYSFRYNTVTDTATSQPMMDQHGDAPSGGNCAYQSCFGAEVYGNDFTVVAGQTDFRGSKYLVFYNGITSTTGTWNGWGLRDEYCDCANACAGESTDSIPQYINNSYSFNSRMNLSGSLKNFYSRGFADCQASCGYIVNEDDEYFNHKISFNGTSGVGCGTATAMNLITPTLTGAGFWVPNAAIDPDAASCNNLAGYVGANNAIAAGVNGNTGTLYRWDGDSWEAFYTPYAYPHPLREGADTTPPSVTIATDNPSAITSDSLSVTGTASDAVGVGSCKFRIGSAPDGSNGTVCTGTTTWVCAASGFASGANTLYVGCGDAAGNWGSDSITVNYTAGSAEIGISVGSGAGLKHTGTAIKVQ